MNEYVIRCWHIRRVVERRRHDRASRALHLEVYQTGPRVPVDDVDVVLAGPTDSVRFALKRRALSIGRGELEGSAVEVLCEPRAQVAVIQALHGQRRSLETAAVLVIHAHGVADPDTR